MTARSARTGRRDARPVVEATTPVVVVTCSCGFFPLDQAQHLTAGQAWTAAAKHAELNPDKCRPSMFRDLAPATIAARLPKPAAAPMTDAFAFVA